MNSRITLVHTHDGQEFREACQPSAVGVDRVVGLAPQVVGEDVALSVFVGSLPAAVRDESDAGIMVNSELGDMWLISVSLMNVDIQVR
jgi:hypothetical protein